MCIDMTRPHRVLRRRGGATRATAPRRPSGGVGPTGPGRCATRADCVSLVQILGPNHDSNVPIQTTQS
jgi:hypothetical protein